VGDAWIAAAVGTGAWSYDDNLDRVPESAAVARRLVAEALADWGLHHLLDETVVVMTELVSNAVDHATGEGMRVTVRLFSDRRVQVAVLDRDPTRPRPRSSSSDAERGRGLLLVAALSDRWGVDMLAGGKRVWAELGAR
jgi:serine/threonine-protein kinase RsbW